MAFLQARTTKVALCVVVFFAASGFATVIPVTNPSFETLPTGGLPDVCGPGCSFGTGVIPGWTGFFFGGQFRPGTQAPFNNFTYFDSLPNGITTAWSSGGTTSQTVSTTVQDGTTYVLTVALGQRKDTPFTASADLLVGSTTMFPATGITPSPGGWSTFTATFTGTAADVGDEITIQLNSTGEQGNFDNVRLTATSLSTVPEPSSMLLLGSGVLVLVQGLRRKLL